jgi:DNA processing protein
VSAAAPWRLLSRGREGWPEQLDHLGREAPSELWVRGARPVTELCASPAVAVVGSRRPSRAGQELARSLALGLARAGVGVVSGLALGIDAAAHDGALRGGGRTVAVLGCGIDRLYPRSNQALGEAIAGRGAIVSEWGPGIEPAPWRFPVRNRLIAALADATLVVEAAERSGALITADHALTLGRDVLAVPGAVWSALGGGVNALLRAGATPITRVEDVLDSLGLAPQPLGAAPAPTFEGLAARAWAALRARPARAETLSLTLGEGAAATAAALSELEVAGALVAERDGTLVAVVPP